MKRTLPWLALAFTLLPACGGSSSSPAQPASGPASPTAPATPGAVAPGGGGATTTVQGCSVSQQDVDGRSEYDEKCGSRSRQCTLEPGDAAWSCACTAASGGKSSCQARAADPGTPPPDCCPAG